MTAILILNSAPFQSETRTDNNCRGFGVINPSASTSDIEVVVIGAGNAGLTAAVRLAQSGAETLLIEQADAAET